MYSVCIVEPGVVGTTPQKVLVALLLQHTEAIACLAFDLSKSKISTTFNGFLNMAI